MKKVVSLKKVILNQIISDGGGVGCGGVWCGEVGCGGAGCGVVGWGFANRETKDRNEYQIMY